MKSGPAGFTVFELLAVLSIIGTVLFVMFGSYGNWGASHAIRGAAEILYAGLTEAQTLAAEHGKIAGFRYGNALTNRNQEISSFQTYLCFPARESETAAQIEERIVTGLTNGTDRLEPPFTFKPWTPRHRLPGRIRIRHVRESGYGTDPRVEEEGVLFFRPNGSAFSPDGTDGPGSHCIQLETREIYTPHPGEKAEPLKRLFRIDLDSGGISEVNTGAGTIF